MDTPATPPSGDYADQWKIVDSLEQQGLFKSALEQVEAIYAQAKKDNKGPQTIKALLFRGKYTTMLEEDGFVKAVAQFETELKSAQPTEQAILHSLLGELYATYLSNQGWRISNRTPIPDGEGGDIQTWSAAQIESRALEHYKASLDNIPLLQSTPSEYVRDISTPGVRDTATAPLRPTLFDILGYRALDYFSNESNYLTEPAYKFYIDDPEAFAPVNRFVETKFPTRDSSSRKWAALQLYQKVLASHQQDADPSARIDADLLRLQFMRNNAVHPQKDEFYEQALLYIHKEQYFHASDAEIIHTLANFYVEQADKNPKPNTYRQRAVTECEDAIRRHPGTYGAELCANLVANLHIRSIQLQCEQVNLPERPSLVQVQYRNLSKIWVKVVKVPSDPDLLNERDWNQRLPYLNAIAPVQTREWAVPDPGDFENHSTEISIDALPVGAYYILMSDNAEFDPKRGYTGYADFAVSELAAANHHARGQFGIWVANRNTGAPLKGVKADFFKSEWNRSSNRSERRFVTSGTSDASGLVQVNLPENTGCFVRLSNADDTLWLGGQVSHGRDYERNISRRMHFFTDRSLYRPGQTVYFKGILLEYSKEGLPSIIKNTPVKVTFYDANGQPKSSLDLRSNQFGTVNGAFTAPASGLTGNMSIRADNLDGAASFNVEEYKRPKFEVSFKPQEGAYRLNEKITVKGEAKNYAGSVVDGAQVRYRVVRQARFPFWDWWSWRPMPWSSEAMEIANGETTTGADGTYSISFEALPDRAVPAKEQPVFDYTVYADVTDISGETRSSEQTVSVGYVALTVEIGLGQSVHADSLNKIALTTNNLAGQFQAAKGKISIQRLTAPDKMFNQRYWEKPDQWVLTERNYKQDFPAYAWQKEDEPESWAKDGTARQLEFNTADAKTVDLNGGQIRPGYYQIELNTTDAYGTPVTLKRIVAVWNNNNRQYQSKTPVLIPDKPSAEPGETVLLTALAPQAGLRFLVTAEYDGRLQNPVWTSNSADPLAFTLKESDRGGLILHGFCVWNNRIYLNSGIYVNVPWSNKDLDIRFETFRDKLAPGQAEEWRLRISGPKKEKIAAEMVAAMYDASLDQFLPHSWGRIAFPGHYAQVYWQSSGNYGAQSASFLYDSDSEYKSIEWRSYRTLDWFGFPMYGGRYAAPGGMYQRKAMDRMDDGAVMAEAAPAAGAAQELKMVAMDGVALKNGDREEASATPPPAPPPPASAPPSTIRTNLNETVFFFPELRTDANGDVLVKFKMNEALTRWKFLAFAHTAELRNAVAVKEVVTQKDLMVIVNAPRFLRAGDQLEFAAKVSNLSKETINGTATLALFDAATMQPVETNFGLTAQSGKVSFSAPAGQSAPLRWTLKVPADFSGAVTWQVFADGKTVRDGEESTIPVVTNRMMVTETLPITVRGGQTKTFVFDNIKGKKGDSFVSHKYTLEFTSNPAWYVVQSLPYLMEYPHECSEQVFSRFYANTLASSVTQKMPNIRKVYDRWKGTDAMKSNLSKNQDLKYALLEETPWVFDAQNEEQQKQNIALLFDLNRMADERERALNTLAERQSNAGGWSWFPGGQDSWYITQYILEGFGHLDRLGALNKQDDARVGRMTIDALDFCIRKVEEQYRELERMVNKGQAKWDDDHLDGMVIHYLYARSFFKVDKLDKVTAYYLGQAEKHWLGKGIYQEGLLALALKRFGKPEAAMKIVNSLRERALVKEELGMYWAFDWGYYWYQLPIETQSLMVEVFDEVAADATAVENLRIWLLKNKQTNRWESTKATAEAAYALLLHGDNWLANSQTVQVQVGGKNLKPAEVEAGTGYFKQQWSGAEVKPSWSEIKVENPNSNIVWGAAYWQYFEDLDKITSFKKTPLTIVKTLYREENSPTGPKLVALQSGDGLHVGDKVKVRIEIRVDRAMEFVHLKDMRAAGFEPVNVLSGYRWQGGLGYYESTKDLATHFFIDYLPRGTFVLEYPVVVSHKGDMSNGITTLQCMYAPEFTSHSEGIRVRVE